MDFLTILRIFRRKVWILIGIPVLTIVCSVFFISRMDKKYKSVAQIATGFTTDDDVKLNEGGTNPFEINTNFTNIIESMNSIPVLSLVSYRLILHDLEDSKPFREFKASDRTADVVVDQKKLAWAKPIFKSRLEHFKPLNSVDPDDRVLYAILKGYEYDHESLVKKLWIARVTSSDFISVEYVSENPYLSALIVNAACEEFIHYNKALKVDRSSESIDFLEALVKEKKKTLDEKSANLNTYKVTNNVSNYTAESESKITLIADYELNRDKEEKTMNGLELSLNNAEGRIQSSGKSNQQEVIQVNQRVIDLRRQISESSNSSTEASKAKVNRLRDELQLEVSRLDAMNRSSSADDSKALEKERDQLKLELRISKSNLASIEQGLRRLKYDVSGFATKEAGLSDLTRAVEFASNDYALVQDKYNTAKNKALVIGSSIRQTLIGQPSYEAEPSKALMLMALAGAGSLALCVIVILAIEYMDFSLRQASRLERITGLKNIGSVNLIKTAGFNLVKTFNNKNVDKESEIFIHFLRKLRYEIQTSKSKVFLITSTQVKVGKSFMIICLSYTLSLINKKVLIIDTNFRHNSLTKMLLPKLDQPKLLKRVNDEKSPEEPEGREPDAKNTKDNEYEYKETHQDTQKDNNRNGSNGGSQNTDEKTSDRRSIIYRTEFQGVDIIGNIGGYDSPSEILAGRDFKDVIDNLSSRYDYILMEGSSLNEYSDSKELIEYVDKVIAVFGAETVLNYLDKESIQYLKSVKGKMLGTVLNKVQVQDLF
ncbi:MAG TPA: hypothetical protein VK517_04965 [Cyclobacteriaceae bacterium]|nr:hypothetical protein [Cyclobacteriaceae bacterium]